MSSLRRGSVMDAVLSLGNSETSPSARRLPVAGMSPESEPEQESVPAPAASTVILDVLDGRIRGAELTRVCEDAATASTIVEALASIVEKTSVLLDVSRKVSRSLRFEDLCGDLVATIKSLLSVSHCLIWLQDAHVRQLVCFEYSGVGVNRVGQTAVDAGVAGWVLQHGEPLTISDPQQDDRFNTNFPRGFPSYNCMCAPIESMGVIEVHNKTPSGTPFTDDDLTMLSTLCHIAYPGLKNTQLHMEILRARKEEAQLLEVTSTISQELELQPLLEKIIDTVTAICGADRSTLFLHDPKTNELYFNVAQGLGNTTIRFPSHLGIAGTVFTSGETINIPDAYADPRFNPSVDRKTGYKTNTILTMPVTNKQSEPVGVIQVLNKSDGAFTTLDEERVRAFCSQASIALENAKLFEDVTRMKNYNESILQSMSSSVITLNGEGKVIKINRAAHKLFRLSFAHSELADNDAYSEAMDALGQILFDRNQWVSDMLTKILQTGEEDTALDTTLIVGDDGDDDEVSVNLTLVPLTSGKGDQKLGFLLVIDDISEEKRIKGTMSRYMSKELVDQLLGDAASMHNALGGIMLETTVLFTDIRQFTSISEHLGPQESVKLLNEYFEIMVDIIMDHSGTLDKYIGDAIMAVFGAPIPGPDDADNAVRAVIKMAIAAREYNKSRIAEDKFPVYMNYGLNTDLVLSGNIGSLKRMEYTVIGDGVNLASRLEGANKAYTTEILISEFTVKRLKDRSAYRLREVDVIRVKGKQKPVKVFEVLDHHTDDTYANLSNILPLYEAGRALYKVRKWTAAKAVFAEAAALNPEQERVSALYADRCAAFEKDPPPEDWDFVHVMQSK